MATFTTISKNSATMTNLAKNSATFSNEAKGGGSWKYNQVGISYNGVTDLISGLVVYYNTLGKSTTFTNITKS